MERKTKVTAEDGRQDLLITRDFELPVELLFKAYTEPELVAQWMGTKVIKLESRRHGSWEFQTSDASGQVVFAAHGVIHELVADRSIVRTFEMAGGFFPAQLEFLDFEPLGAGASRLRMQIVHRSAAHREQMLQLPFAHGLSMAHDRLQEAAAKLIAAGVRGSVSV